jgi:hypothetical protein
VIITSRNPDWTGIATPLPVQEFTRAESVRLLRSRLPRLAAGDAARVAGTLGDLPLAVDQAAALLAETGMAVQAYLDLLAERTHDVLAQGDPPGGYPVSLTASWTVAFDRLATDNPAALRLLTLAAWLSPEPVPLTLITDHTARLPAELAIIAADPLALAKVTATLRRRALARITTGSLQLHRVPTALLRARAGRLGEDGGWPATAARLLAAAAPADPWNNPAVWPAWRQLLPHVLAVVDPTRDLDEVTDDVRRLLGRAAAYLNTRGEPGRPCPCPSAPTGRTENDSATTTPTPSSRPAASPSTSAPWASTNRHALSTKTPSPDAAASSATTTPTPSPRPTTSPTTSAPWANTNRHGPSRKRLRNGVERDHRVMSRAAIGVRTGDRGGILPSGNREIVDIWRD